MIKNIYKEGKRATLPFFLKYLRREMAIYVNTRGGLFIHKCSTFQHVSGAVCHLYNTLKQSLTNLTGNFDLGLQCGCTHHFNA